MSDFCNCSNCPHHCDDQEESTEKDTLEEQTKNADKRIQKLKSDIKKLGFNLEETKDGLRISR